MTVISDSPVHTGVLPILSPQKPLPGAPRKRFPALGLIFAFSFGLLLLRNLAIPGPVCNDEVVYKTYSQHADDITKTTSRTTLGGYPNALLYFHLYQTVHAFGSNTYAAAKTLNTFFFCLAIFPIYGTARIFVTRPQALFVVVAGLLCGVSTYTTCFMPESLYYFVFWVFAYCFLSLVGSRPKTAAVLAGALIGALILIKPHGIMLLVALNGVLLSLAVWSLRLNASWKTFLVAFLFLNLSSLITVQFLKVLLGHSISTSILGATYGQVISNVMSRLFGDVPRLLLYLGGHLVLFGIILFLPLLAIVWRLATVTRTDRLPIESVALGLLVLWGSTVLIAGTIKASMEGWIEEVPRIHQRYYNFLVPLFLIGFYAFYELFSKKAPRRFSVACLAGGTALVLGAMFIVPRLALTHIDCPDAFWLRNDYYPHTSPPEGSIWLSVIVCLSVAVLVLFGRFRSTFPHLFSAFFLATVLIGTWKNYLANQEVAASYTNEVFVGGLLNSMLSPSEIEHGIVIAPDTLQGFALRVALNGVPWQTVPPAESKLNLNELLPSNTLWAAITDHYQFEIPPGGALILCPGWKLLLLTPRTTAADFPGVDVRQRGQFLNSGDPDSWRKTGADGPLKEVPVPVVPKPLVGMKWNHDGVGEVLGRQSYVDFALMNPQYVRAINVKYSYKYDNSPANFRISWRRSDQQEFVQTERSAALKLLTNPGERTATIWVNDVIDEFRVFPNDKACVFRITEMAVLVSESGEGQPKLAGESGEGSLDEVNDTHIAGWAYDPTQSDNPILLDVYDGETKLKAVVADALRSDLIESRKGNGVHGFSYPTPPSLKDGKLHTVHVKFAGTNRELPGSPMDFKSP